MSLQYVTACADWNGETTVKAAIYGVQDEPVKAAEVASAELDDRAVQAFAERHLAEHGLEVRSTWTTAPDPGGKPGDRRPVWIAEVGPVSGPVPCQRPGVDPEDWFPVVEVDGVTPEAAIRHLEERAAALCAGCPVRESCLAAGLHESYGVWGGEAPHQRRDRRRRQREMERSA